MLFLRPLALPAALLQRALFPARLIAQAEEELTASEAKEAAREEARSRIAGLGGSSLPPQGKAGSPEAKLKERQRMRKVLEKVRRRRGGRQASAGQGEGACRAADSPALERAGESAGQGPEMREPSAG